MESLKQALVEAVENFPMDIVHIDLRDFGPVFRQMAAILNNLFLVYSNNLCKHFSNQTSSLNFSRLILCINIYGRTGYIYTPQQFADVCQVGVAPLPPNQKRNVLLILM